MWALGMVMHLLFTGSFPFPEGQFRQPLRFDEKRWSKISEEGQDVVRGLLEKKASKRMTAQKTRKLHNHSRKLRGPGASPSCHFPSPASRITWYLFR